MKSILSIIYFNAVERKSWIILLIFIALLISVYSYIKQVTVPKTFDFSCYNTLFEVDSTLEAKRKIIDKQVQKISSQNNNDNQQIASFPFDPNAISKDSLALMGLNRFASANLIKYRASGGRFNVKEDVKKIYGVTDQVYSKIEQNIFINPISKKNDSLTSDHQDGTLAFLSKGSGIKDSMIKEEPPIEAPVHLIDINTADEIQLQYVRGIGPTFARRIIKYRELLGGFYSKFQLMEVYGLDREKYIEVKDQITVGGDLERIDINASDYKIVANHPYISYQQAKLIVAYQLKHGPYKDAYDIVKIGVMDSSFVDKILPYVPDSLNNYKAQAPLTSL